MRIERLERSKHQQERILVFLEGEKDPLRVTEDELLHFGLYQGLDIGADTVVELQKCAARSETRVRAANMISARPLSKKELGRRLRQKGASDADADAAADWLEEIGAVDDLAYAKLLVRHYSGRGYGEARLRDELYRRGVPRELWDEALDSAPPPGEIIAHLASAKGGSALADEAQRRRFTNMLLRRGFSWGDVKDALASLGAQIEEE